MEDQFTENRIFPKRTVLFAGDPLAGARSGCGAGMR
jgi:hypothetical protein